MTIQQSFQDLKPTSESTGHVLLPELRELHLFAGAGGGILGGLLLGHRPVCAVEIEPYCRRSLMQRQRDGALPWFPCWDDVNTFAGHPWRGIVDAVCGGFPCQDISVAGKGGGITAERSGLWFQMARIVREVRPAYVFIENSPMLVGRGLDRVLWCLAEMGFDARWGVVSAEDAAWLAGDPAVYHERERIWILGKSTYHVSSKDDAVGRVGECRRVALGRGIETALGQDGEAGANSLDRHGQVSVGEAPDRPRRRGPWNSVSESSWWKSEPDVGGIPYGMASTLDIHGAYAAGDVARMAKSVPNRVSRLKAIGNGQVPQAAALAWRLLMDAFESQ